jgi:dihydroneopterin aldolase
MSLVFDYDPLIAKIEAIAQQSKYETQEYLMTLIASACAKYEEILEVELFLRKVPVKNNSGSLGVRTKFTLGDLKSLRAKASTAS